MSNTKFQHANLLGVLDYDFIPTPPPPLDIKVKLQVNYFTLGELQAVTIPGEAVSRLGLSIRSHLHSPHRMILGLTNNSLGYFVGKDEWNSGRNEGYEEGVSIDSDVGEKTKKKLIALIENSKKKPHVLERSQKKVFNLYEAIRGWTRKQLR